MRKLASVRKIDFIEPIENADSIEVAVVGGWKVVIKKGDFTVGDIAIYCEIDSWIPHEIAPFLSKGTEPREYNDIKGERLRTIKLRGQLSQGLLLPISLAPHSQVGDDLTEILNIQKWEPAIPANLAGEVIGAFPGQIPKTDQERIQNLSSEFTQWHSDQSQWEVTEKLDGSSMTVFVMNDVSGVCSRNLNLRKTENNSLWSVARRENLIEKIQQTGRNLALQGELIGEGIQKNPYKIRGQQFHLFDIYDIDAGQYLLPEQRKSIAAELNILHVPIVADSVNLANFKSVGDMLTFAEAKSQLHPQTEREGLVFKNTQKEVSFKAISNKFLLKSKG